MKEFYAGIVKATKHVLELWQNSSHSFDIKNLLTSFSCAILGFSMRVDYVYITYINDYFTFHM